MWNSGSIGTSDYRNCGVRKFEVVGFVISCEFVIDFNI